jgi:hypothetical protein
MMAFDAASLLCPFTVALDIFMLKKDIAKTHCNNAELNVQDNAPLAVYQTALTGHWLVMGLKIDTSPVDAWLSKMQVAIENIAFFTTVGNLVVNKLMERKAAAAVAAKAASTEEPKWTMVITKNMCQVVSRAMETLADAPKQEDRKPNLCLTGFEAKEGETKTELVQRLNTKLLQGQMRLQAKVVIATQQWPATMRAFAVAVGARPSTVLLKFATSEDCQAAL